MDELKQKVIAALRITTNDPGILSEVDLLMQAAAEDLRTTGIQNDKDPLFAQAVVTYCKANFGFDNPDGARFSESYQMLKQKMANTEEYRHA